MQTSSWFEDRALNLAQVWRLVEKRTRPLLHREHVYVFWDLDSGNACGSFRDRGKAIAALKAEDDDHLMLVAFDRRGMTVWARFAEDF